MGKGDKKTRRGKIILGTFGVRRRRKTVEKPGIKQSVAADGKVVKEKRPVKEKAEVKEVKVGAEVKEPRVAKEKASPRTAKASREKKEVSESGGEPKAKKEKKS